MLFDIPKYEPVPEESVTLFEMSQSDKAEKEYMDLHLKLCELRDKYDFSVPKNITYPFKCEIDEGLSQFNTKACSFVSVDEWLSERLEKEGVFPECVCVDLDKYGTLPQALYEVLKKVSIETCKDVLVGLPVWVMEKTNEDKG